MSCKIHFDPEPIGISGYICECGWYGTEPHYRMDGYPIFEFFAECPNCGVAAEEENVMVIDVGSDVRNVTKVWPNGKEWVKQVRTDVLELRLAGDSRRMSSYSAEKWGSSIMWEVFRALEIKRPEKPVRADFETLDAFFVALNNYKKEWKDIFNKEFTIKQLLDGKTKKVGLVVAKEQTKSIVMSLFGTLDGLKMNTGYKLISMASTLSKSRAATAEKIRNKIMSRTTVKAMLDAMASMPYYSIDMADLNAILISLFNCYGNITIRTNVFTRMKTRKTWTPRLWTIKSSKHSVYEKSTWKHNDFKVLNASFFCNEEWSMNRGKPVADEEGNGWLYNPETGNMDLVLSNKNDWHFTHGADWLRSDVHMGGKVPRHPYAD
jgi:hypothetical protein